MGIEYTTDNYSFDHNTFTSTGQEYQISPFQSLRAIFADQHSLVEQREACLVVFLCCKYLIKSAGSGLKDRDLKTLLVSVHDFRIDLGPACAVGSDRAE